MRSMSRRTGICLRRLESSALSVPSCPALIGVECCSGYAAKTNLAPARLTALALCVAAARRGDGTRALREWRLDAGRTDSPNAGHPMAAMAGALGVRLGKRGDYVLGDGLREPTHEDIGQACVLATEAAVVTGAALVVALVAAGSRA